MAFDGLARAAKVVATKRDVAESQSGHESSDALRMRFGEGQERPLGDSYTLQSVEPSLFKAYSSKNGKESDVPLLWGLAPLAVATAFVLEFYVLDVGNSEGGVPGLQLDSKRLLSLLIIEPPLQLASIATLIAFQRRVGPEIGVPVAIAEIGLSVALSLSADLPNVQIHTAEFGVSTGLAAMGYSFGDKAGALIQGGIAVALPLLSLAVCPRQIVVPEQNRYGQAGSSALPAGATEEIDKNCLLDAGILAADHLGNALYWGLTAKPSRKRHASYGIKPLAGGFMLVAGGELP